MHAVAATLPLETSALSECAKEQGFALLREGTCWRAYRRPVEVLAATDPEMLAEVLARIDRRVQAGGEAAGFLSYEAGYALEPKLHRLLGKDSRPLCWFGLYDEAHALEQISLPPDAVEEIVENVAATITSEEYDQAIASIRDYIAAGDVYQINFTYPVTFRLKCTAWQLFAALCRRHPVPYAAFLNTGQEQIVSLSPELFFNIQGDRITVKPMKGTADRGLTLDDDKARGEALHASEKNRAENAMIVDLMRNDLGRICRAGTVKTTHLFQVERFPSVWQMTSTIEGHLREECTPDSIVRALFPSGSVTGAPKIRAMELISELESLERGVYTGAIGYFAPGQAQFNVAIRTAVVRDGMGRMGVGGGITFDSSAPEEWKESQSKAAFLTQSAPEFKLIETMRWEGEYTLLEKHLNRLRASAEYFGFRFDEMKVREGLREFAARFTRSPQRVRLLLAQDGSHELSNTEPDSAFFGRVRLSAHRVRSTDRFLYHKTTQRKLYIEELSAAKVAQCDDTLFFNERGELTEGTVHNVFVVTGGVWRTPPLASGILPGTYRAQFLAQHPDAREEILTLNDLKHADAIYLCNSVRSMFPVRLAEQDSASSAAGA